MLKNKNLLGLVAAISLSLAPFVWPSTACRAWQWANPLPQGNTLNSVTYANCLWVAVGDFGAIITSPDGVNWSVRNSGVTTDLKDSAWGNGTWVAVGYQDTILTSADGVTWNLSHSGVSINNLDTVSYGAGLFVASGYNVGSWTVTSENGTSWTQQGLGGFSDILWDGERFIGVSNSVSTSIDGITWSVLSFWGPWKIAWNGALYVGVGAGGTGVGVSLDAKNWTSHIFGDNYEIYGVGYGNGLFMAVGRYSSGTDSVYVAETSTNGIIWDEHVLSAPDVPTAVAWGPSRFITVGNNGCLLSSSNGSSWSDSNAVSLSTLNAITQGEGQFVVVGEEGAILTSPDAVVWTLRALRPGYILRDVVFSAGRYVAVGWWDTIVSSLDGIIWTYNTAGTGSHLQGVTFANGQFVAVGYGVAATSPDGVSWTVQVLDQPISLNCVIWTGAGYFAAGAMCTATSVDGLHWQITLLEEKYDFQDVLWDGQKFVAVGSLGNEPEGTSAIIMTSADGTTWHTAHVGLYLSQYMGVARRADGKYVVVGGMGEILASSDAVSWTTEFSGTYRWFRNVRSFDNMAITIGEGGAIFRQACGIGPPIPGDCDGVGTVSIGEVQKAINMFLGLEPPACNVDCDRNGMVSIGEIQKVINGFLGLAARC